MLNDETSSIVFDHVYDARKDSPWLNRLRIDTSSALYDELAMPAISPVRRYHLAAGSHPLGKPDGHRATARADLKAPPARLDQLTPSTRKGVEDIFQ
jgi:hypothetical protein